MKHIFKRLKDTLNLVKKHRLLFGRENSKKYTCKCNLKGASDIIKHVSLISRLSFFIKQFDVLLRIFPNGPFLYTVGICIAKFTSFFKNVNNLSNYCTNI